MRLYASYLTHQMERLLNHFIFREFISGSISWRAQPGRLISEAHGATSGVCHHLMVSCSALWRHKQKQRYQLGKSWAAPSCFSKGHLSQKEQKSELGKLESKDGSSREQKAPAQSRHWWQQWGRSEQMKVEEAAADTELQNWQCRRGFGPLTWSWPVTQDLRGPPTSADKMELLSTQEIQWELYSAGWSDKRFSKSDSERSASCARLRRPS